MEDQYGVTLGVGGPPRDSEPEATGQLFGVLVEKITELTEKLETQNKELQEVRQEIKQQKEAPTPVPMQNPTPPTPPPQPANNELMVLLLKGMMDTNQLMHSKMFERPQSSPTSPLVDPVVQELMRSKDEFYRQLLEIKTPAASGAEGAYESKIKGVVDKLDNVNFLEKARRQLMAQFRDRLKSRIPPVCGVCDFCGEYDYEGSSVFMCEHKGGPGPRGEAPLIREDIAPPKWCPKRNGIWETMIQVPGLRNTGGR